MAGVNKKQICGPGGVGKINSNYVLFREELNISYAMRSIAAHCFTSTAMANDST